MDFEPKKFNDIVADMQSRISQLTDFQVGSVTRSLVESFSYELGLLYQKMKLVYLSGFIDSAEGTDLEKVVAILGIQRRLPGFAIGFITFQRDKGKNDILIPIGTKVSTVATRDQPAKLYLTTEEKIFKSDSSSVDVNIKAVDPGEEQNTDIGTITVMPKPVPGIKSVNNKLIIKLLGKQKETDDELRLRAKNSLISAGKATRISVEDKLMNMDGVLDVLLKEDPAKCGMFTLLVNGPVFGLNNPDDERIRISSAIDEVKAAGVYVELLNPTPVLLDGIFRIEIAKQRQLDQDDQLKLESYVSQAITDFILYNKIGTPILLAKLMKEVLSIDGVDNLTKVEINTPSKDDPSSILTYDLGSVTITIEPYSSFKPQGVYVASSDKTLAIRIEMYVPGITSDNAKALKASAKGFFDKFNTGDPFSTDDLLSEFQKTIPALDKSQVVIIPDQWYKSEKNLEKDPGSQQITKIHPCFVEKITQGTLFFYSSYIELTGAFSIQLKENLLSEDKENIASAALDQVNKYLDTLNPEQTIILDDLIGNLKTIDGVKDAQFVEKDFLVDLNKDGITKAAPDRFKNKKIEVGPFEKPRLCDKAFIISYHAETITFSVGELSLNLVSYDETSGSDKTKKDALKGMLTNRINHFFDNGKPGIDFDLNSLIKEIGNTSVNSLPVTVRSLIVSSLSENDNRVQSTSITDMTKIHVRSMEVPYMASITSDLIQIYYKDKNVS